ncbi:MAG: ribosome-associated translation inhibitor RaiA [Fimbriimonadaceae bacterium]|nr:ribosome-associated translation inhibitor RaiA [Fimbriimonadaceae bacterium]QYK56938.1 MAG: ribosome-associated translation inhibitor RaiA [Fimbriimonadaceae bacterium]
MELLVRNAEGNLTEKDKEYAAKKLGRLDRYFSAADKVEMVHREEKRGHRIEVTVFADGLYLHASETETTTHAAIDRIADKMENRLRRLKTRLVDAHKKRGRAVATALEEVESVPLEDEEVGDVREERRFSMKPMSVEEAILQIELGDHPFFLFRNQDSQQTELLYKLDGGGYGLLIPHG